MRIISNFKDYYDGVHIFGHEKYPIYNRKSYTEQKKSVPFIFPYYETGFIVGVCGKIFPGIRCWNKERTKCIYAYSLETFEENLKEHLTSKELGRYYNPYLRVRYRRKLPIRENIKRFYEQKVNYEFKEPIFIISDYYERGIGTRYTIQYNTQLKNYGFEHVMNPYTIYQELDMWVSNQAVPLKPIPQPSDEVMAEIKGFDKYSFRKDKKK